jgi:para-nitrobenzyl esterase
MTAASTVDIESGTLRGRAGQAGIEFLGIPFASAPRLAPPGAPAGWSGVRDATVAGAAAPQPQRAVAEFTHGVAPATAEECLNLNVFTPGLDAARPVLVWLHGGGFAIGHAAAGLYHGAWLAQTAEIVVVTANYRLGDLGWLWHPALAGAPDAPAGNWGLQDQLAALRWVQRNIAAFGGDPARVTLAGQSAGALSAMDLMVAPGAAGLFGRLLLQSPPLADLAQAPEVAIGWAEALSAALGADGFDPATLRAASPDRLVTVHEQLIDEPRFRGTRGGALPTIDPAILPRSPAEEPGAAASVDVLVGHTADEGTFFFDSPWRPSPPPERIAAIVAHLCHTDAPDAVLADYRRRAGAAGQPDDDPSLLIRIATDAMVGEPVARWARARAAALAASDGSGRVFRYRFDHPGAGARLKATHTAEVPLLFGSWRDGGAGERLGGQAPGAEAVAAELVGAWAGFIKYGDPGWEPVANDPAQSPHVIGSAESR